MTPTTSSGATTTLLKRGLRALSRRRLDAPGAVALRRTVPSPPQCRCRRWRCRAAHPLEPSDQKRPRMTRFRPLARGRGVDLSGRRKRGSSTSQERRGIARSQLGSLRGEIRCPLREPDHGVSTLAEVPARQAPRRHAGSPHRRRSVAPRRSSRGRHSAAPRSPSSRRGRSAAEDRRRDGSRGNRAHRRRRGYPSGGRGSPVTHVSAHQAACGTPLSIVRRSIPSTSYAARRRSTESRLSSMRTSAYSAQGEMSWNSQSHNPRKGSPTLPVATQASPRRPA